MNAVDILHGDNEMKRGEEVSNDNYNKRKRKKSDDNYNKRKRKKVFYLPLLPRCRKTSLYLCASKLTT
jgi:hypothetical protein